jgi:hypothetical protein
MHRSAARDPMLGALCMVHRDRWRYHRDAACDPARDIMAYVGYMIEVGAMGSGTMFADEVKM